MCSFCDIQNAAPINIFSDEEIERIVIGVYSGLITPQSLDVATYLRVAEKLTNGVYNEAVVFRGPGELQVSAKYGPSVSTYGLKSKKSV